MAYHYFGDFKVDVFGYDRDTNRYTYSVETPYSCKVREAKAYDKSPDERNEWIFPCGTYIYIISPAGKKIRLWLNG